MQRISYLILFFLCFLTALISCGGGKGKLLLPDSSRWTDQDIPLEELQTGSVNTDSVAMLDKMRSAFAPGDTLISGRPVSFYLNQRDISNTARDFYLLKFIPSDDDPTFALCDSILSTNDTTRPFYFFLFMRMMRISDGVLSEGMADYAVRYVLQYPNEFYMRMKEPSYRGYYNLWIELVASALVLRGIENPTTDDVRNYIIAEQTKKIRMLTPSLRHQIESFADTVAKIKEKNR